MGDKKLFSFMTEQKSGVQLTVAFATKDAPEPERALTPVNFLKYVAYK